MNALKFLKIPKKNGTRHKMSSTDSTVRLLYYTSLNFALSKLNLNYFEKKYLLV